MLKQESGILVHPGDVNRANVCEKTSVVHKLDEWAQTLSDHCNQKQFWYLSGLSLLYVVSTFALASRKLMWNDELFTFYISRLGSFSEIWSALLTGADQIPPIFYLITRASFSLLGVNHISIRLPEAVGFWIMSLCLFRFVSNRSSPLYGFMAMLFPLVTTAYDYAYEARPYGLVLGFGGLALICWQSVAEGQYRKVSLIGLALSCAAALSSHYYAVLIFLPLAFGELVRSFFVKRLDWAIWVALGFATIPLFLFLPLIEQARTYSVDFWAPPHWTSIPEFYYFLLIPALSPLVAVLMLAAGCSISETPGDTTRSQGLHPQLRAHEIAAAFGFIGIPVVAVGLAAFFTNAFTYRYALPAVIGFSILVPFAAARLLEGRAIVGVALLIALCGAFILLDVKRFQIATSVSQDQSKAYEFLRSKSGANWPIVVSDAHTFMMLAHYTPLDISSRLVYLADPESAFRHLGHRTVDRGLLDLKTVFHVRVENYEHYLASQERFFVYGPLVLLNWLIDELIASDRRIEVKGKNGDSLLFLVSGRELRR